MVAVPATRTWVAGEIVLASHFNTNIRDVLNYLLALPAFEGRQSTTQNLTTATWTTVTMDAEDLDSAGGHSTVTNNSRYTAQYAGWYQVGGAAAINTSATGMRATRWMVNGSVLNASQITDQGVASFPHNVPARAKHVFLNVGDYLELQAYQNSGGTLATVVSAETACGVMARWARS